MSAERTLTRADFATFEAWLDWRISLMDALIAALDADDATYAAARAALDEGSDTDERTDER